MWISRETWTRLTGDVHELKQWRIAYDAGLPVTKFKTCATCRGAFEPRSISYSFLVPNWAQKLPEVNYSQTHCDRCAPAEAAKQQAANWAMNNPDKAKLCMEKHKEGRSEST